jgi:hypothetical protein
MLEDWGAVKEDMMIVGGWSDDLMEDWAKARKLKGWRESCSLRTGWSENKRILMPRMSALNRRWDELKVMRWDENEDLEFWRLTKPSIYPPSFLA